MYRRNYCSAPGNKGFHHYSKETHQCACGRWDRGFAPKKVSVLPRGECQICQRHQAIEHGTLHNHGYTRPGFGFLTGGCPGVGYAPFPKTDSLERYLAALNKEQTRLSTKLAETRVAEVLLYRYDAPGQSLVKRELRKKIEVEVKKDDSGHYIYENGRHVAWVPGFDELHSGQLGRLQTEIGQILAEIARVSKRIKEGQEILARGT